ncbi:hypothetical protein ACIB24_17370 [Spongisporangium articulatum]|uniref:Extracellular repeat, HAF family n=1 Tax=Spongisporangium articulatum TaxID=3362603 RepID=A0ABW8AR54_9ACTN
MPTKAVHRALVRVAVLVVAAASLTAWSTGPASAAPTTYQVKQLPLPSGWQTGTTARGDGGKLLAGAGQDPDGVERPLLWKNGKVSALPSPGGVTAGGSDVNSKGVVLANTRPTDDAWPLPFVVTKKGGVVTLAVPPGARTTIGYAINDAGLVVGYSYVGGAYHGIVWSIATPNTYQDLGAGDGTLFLTGLTESGVIVGTTQNAHGDTRALRGTLATGLSPLPGVDTHKSSGASGAAGAYVFGTGALPGTTGGWGILWNGDTPVALPPSLRANGLNSQGLVAGYDVSTPLSATAWANGTSWVLPGVAGPDTLAYSTFVTDVSETGVIAGSSGNADGTIVPVVWKRG